MVVNMKYFFLIAILISFKSFPIVVGCSEKEPVDVTGSVFTGKYANLISNSKLYLVDGCGVEEIQTSIETTKQGNKFYYHFDFDRSGNSKYTVSSVSRIIFCRDYFRACGVTVELRGKLLQSYLEGDELELESKFLPVFFYKEKSLMSLFGRKFTLFDADLRRSVKTIKKINLEKVSYVVLDLEDVRDIQTGKSQTLMVMYITVDEKLFSVYFSFEYGGG